MEKALCPVIDAGEKLVENLDFVMSLPPIKHRLSIKNDDRLIKAYLRSSVTTIYLTTDYRILVVRV